MKLLLTINEQDISPGAEMLDSADYFKRKAVRAVVVNEKGEIALMYATKSGYHKLPGGGIEDGEDIIQALSRELMEEIGCEVKIITEVGEIIELRDQRKLYQTSYCYLVAKIGQQQPLSLTDGELEDGFDVVWVKNIEEAVETLQKDDLSDYIVKFMNKRDLVFLSAAKLYL